jgi:hypothetical protein
VSVNPDTWEIIKILTDNHTKWSQRPWNYAPSTYSQSSIDCARFVTSDLCERVISKISWWRRVKRWNNKGYDIVTNDWKKIEAKVWRIWNSAVVKENQLFDFDANYWGFIFYRTIKNLPPSYYTSLAKKISPAAELRRNISIEIAYILPTEVMRYYWNTAWVKKWIISTTWIAHRPFTYSRAEWLINNPEVPWNRIERNFQYWKHNFLVKSINFTL